MSESSSDRPKSASENKFPDPDELLGSISEDKPDKPGDKSPGKGTPAPAAKAVVKPAAKPGAKKGKPITAPSSVSTAPKSKVKEGTGPASETPEKKEEPPSRKDSPRKSTFQGVGKPDKESEPKARSVSSPGKKRWRSLAPQTGKKGHDEIPTKVDRSKSGQKDGEPEPLPPAPEVDESMALEEGDLIDVQEVPEGKSDTKEYGPGPPEPPEPYRAIETGQHFGRFQLLMEMGQGGMATLFLARIQGPEKFEKLVAIKKIHDHLARDPQFINMFLDEARIAAMIHDPNVVTIFDLGQIENAYFIAMEYIHGQNLTDILRASVRLKKPLPWTHAARIVANAAAGLHAAHELKSAEGRPLGVVHRDVSPQNILVSYEGHVKIVDFGIAYAAEKLSHTGAGILKGKAAYMSPEQTRGDRTIDRRSDIFSLGIVLWECACTKRLFKEENEAATLLRVRNAEVPRPRTIRPHLPPELERIIMRALAKEPDQRLATAGEMAELLEELLVTEGQVISPQKIAKSMNKLFYDKKKIKDKQIKQALQQELLPAMKGVGMVGSSSTSIEMPRIDSAEIVGEPRRRRSGLMVATMALFVGGAAILGTFWFLKPELLGLKKNREPAQPKVVVEAEPREPPPMATTPRRPSRVVLKVTVKPEDAPVVVVFRGKEYKGTMFRMMIPYSTKAETLEVRAQGYLPQSLVVVPTGDSDIPVTLRKAPPRPRPGWKRRTRRKSRRLLKDLPD